MKRKTIICLAAILIFNTISSYAMKFYPPYEEVDGGRLAENMPALFSVETAEKALAASCDFSTSAGSETLTVGYGDSYWSETDGVMKIEKTKADETASFVLQYKPADGFGEGGIYAFVCKIKTENVSGGAPRNILAAWSDSAWLAETYSYDGKQDISGNNDWYTMTQVLKIPANADVLNLQAFLDNGITGTVYFDDFELYQVGLDPLESVLRSPSYKGLIYGDGYSDIDLDVIVSSRDGIYDPADMYLEVLLTDDADKVIYSSEAETLTEKMNFVFSSYGLPEGDYYLQTVLKDKTSDEVISKKEHTIRKRAADYRPSAYVDDNGHYIKNNEKTFINRIYNHSAFDNSDDYEDVAKKAHTMGIDTVSNYGMWWAVDTNDAVENALTYMRNNSMTTHICLSSYWFSDRSGNMGTDLIQQQSDILPLFTGIANLYKNDTALEGYYIFDEPDPAFVGEEIRWNNEILAEADINHPTFGVADKDYDNYGIYTKMTDILGIDPYPIMGKTDDNGVSVDDIAKVGRSVREIKESFPNRPVYYVMQGFDYESNGALRSPTYDELRNMAWQAICEGAEGLDWYAYPEMQNDDSKTITQWESEVTQLLTEVKGYKDVILSDEPAPLYTVSGGGDSLNLSVKRHEGKTYLFAVNNTHEAVNASVKIKGVGVQELSFEPLDVIIQEIEQAEFLSPEAELKAMGFGNGTEIFETAENGSERILYVPADSGVINYTAKISDGASLVIGGREMPQTGKITVRNADSMTVKVIAEDGTTAETRVYRIVKQ